jgi:site-specific DNA-cytosine methylase
MRKQSTSAKGINVLSFFDGVSAGQEALKQLGVPVDNYFAIEIEESAISFTQWNFPDTIQVGNITNIVELEKQDISSDYTFVSKITGSNLIRFVKSLPPIDLVFAGSPCQGFSQSGRGEGFENPRSRLFFNFVQIFNAIKKLQNRPNLKFFFENVGMHEKWKSVISNHLKVQPIFIDASDYSPCARPRLYWTNLEIPESIIHKYKSNDTAQTLMGDSQGKMPSSRVFAYPSFYLKKPEYSDRQVNLVRLQGSSSNSFCIVGVELDSKSGGDGWTLQRFTDGVLPCFKTNNNGFHWGLGCVGVHQSLIVGSEFEKATERQIRGATKGSLARLRNTLKVGKEYPIYVDLDKEQARVLNMKPGRYYAVKPTTKEGEVALGFSPGYLTEEPKNGHKRTIVTKALGNSWSVTVVKLMIDAYCTRKGWSR